MVAAYTSEPEILNSWWICMRWHSSYWIQDPSHLWHWWSKPGPWIALKTTITGKPHKYWNTGMMWSIHASNNPATAFWTSYGFWTHMECMTCTTTRLLRAWINATGHWSSEKGLILNSLPGSINSNCQSEQPVWLRKANIWFSTTQSQICLCAPRRLQDAVYVWRDTDQLSKALSQNCSTWSMQNSKLWCHDLEMVNNSICFWMINP